MRILIFFFLAITFYSSAQNGQEEKKLVEIENAIADGNLDRAKRLTQQLANTTSEYYEQRCYLLFANIAFFQGNLKGMNSFLPRIKDEYPEVSYYKNVLYGHYLLLNNQFALGNQSLEKALDLAKTIQNKRIQISKLLTQLQLIYSSQSREIRGQNSLYSHRLTRKLIAELKSNEPEMELFEKSQFYSLEAEFCSTTDTANNKFFGRKILDFGLENKVVSSILKGNLILAHYAQGEVDRLNHLANALKQTEKCKIILLNSEVYFAFETYYEKKGNIDSAIFWAKKAIYPEFLDQRENLNPYNKLSELYEKQGNIEKALYFKKIGATKLQEISQQNAVNIREYLIEGLERNIDEKNRLLARNKVLITVISIVASILLILLYFVLRLEKRLKKAMETVQKSNTEMEVFSRIVSHDLKAPIFTISKLISYVLGDEKNVSFQSQSYLVAAKDACENADVLINNIMTYLRNKEKEVAFEDIAFGKILAAVKSNLKEQIRINNVVFVEKNLPDTLHVNRTLFTQLLQNLIQNSIKYRQLEVDPILAIHYELTSTGFNLSVQDNGKGIPAEKTESIVKAFEQDLSSSIKDGIGLGLAICSAIVKLHHGVMTISNNTGEGILVEMRFVGKRS